MGPPSDDHSWRRVSLVVVLAAILASPAIHGADQPATGGWVCPPCEHEDHEEVYEDAGLCPICDMGLVRADGAGAAIPSLVEREISFTNGDVRLAGVVLSSPGAHERRDPGLVVIHGSGASDRSQPWASAFARGLAHRGFVVLLPDKRGSGKSGGDWRTASFEDLADDAAAAVERLAGLDVVDPGRVGVIGLSQGGHVAPLVPERTERVAFVVNVSGSVVPITEQVVDEVEKLAERAGFTPAQIERVDAIHRLAIHYALTGEGWEAYEGSLGRALESDLAGHDVVEPFPRTPDHWVWAWARSVGPFDPLPYWERSPVPTLIVYGAEDTQIHVGESVALLLDLPRPAPRTVLVFGDSGHGLRDPTTHRIRPDLLDLVRTWVEHQHEKRGAEGSR